ncbi:unnamed protein product [Spirodela intermedia]|uniref:Uncharacterized protein n=2 Tax=Spirodela intermedia TaxID=51605 RepID=A0A7I8LEI5_SPIIN|nr:unnamed protein product [Spirodela intermedia]CAA6670627.1 unnamed protein product [Spirodela intermedia]CAA7407708.1 unnamed protein product [Spirodela intermedia]
MSTWLCLKKTVFQIIRVFP